VNLVERIIAEDYTSLEVAAALLKLELSGSTDKSLTQSQEVRLAPGQALLKIPVGREDQIRPKDIVGALAGETGIPGSAIGAINIYETYSTVDVPSELAEQVVEGMKGKSIARIRLSRPIEIVGRSDDQ